MKELQKILGSIRRAVSHYDMLRDGDSVAIGLSGGKDSLALLVSLAAMRRFFDKKYTLSAVTVLAGFPGQTTAALADVRALCDRWEVPLYIVETEIADIVFGARKEKNPCSLCANLRRGALCGKCMEIGANTLALGHHRDDVVETFMMNLLETGRLGCFMPVTVYPDSGLRVIRPLIYTEECAIRSLVRVMELPVYRNPCPVDGETNRVKIEESLRTYDGGKRELYQKILGALEHSGLDGWHD